MGIRDKRFYRAINRLLQEELRKGNLPSSKEFSWRLNNYLRDHNLSRPEFNFTPARQGSTAQAHDYNQTMAEVQSDLGTLYESTVDLHNLLTKNFSKFDVDKGKLEYEINALENQLKELILLYSKNGFLNSVYDVFDDMAKVDPETTTAHVDIKEHEVRIPEIKNTSRKLSPQAGVAFALLPEIQSRVDMRTISGQPVNALSESINETWQTLVMSEQKETVAGYYYINFETKQSLNRVAISLHGAKPTLVRVEFSPDNLNWFTLPYHEEGRMVGDAYSFDFPTLEAMKLRILLSKSEPDDQSAAQYFSKTTKSEYKYVLGVKHIGLYELSYPPKAELVSTPLVVDVPADSNFSINKVSLSVEEEVPAATDIRYWIALPPEGDREPEWKPLSPVERVNPKDEQLVDFRNITNAPAVKMGIDPVKALTEYEMESLYANGINFYKIGEVEDKQIIGSSERLFVGKNSWGVKRFALEQADHATHVPSIGDWMADQDIVHEFVTIEDGKPGLLLNRRTHTEATNYMFTAGILSEKLQEVEATVPASTEPIAIYVNGQEVFQGIPDARSKVAYRFNYGWNEVIVLAYTQNTEAANGATLDLNLDARKYGANVYAQAEPMELVSLHDLRFNVKSSDRNKYAIEKTNDKFSVVLNHAVPGLLYDFFFHYVEGTAKDTILFRAEFSKNEQSSTISPKLNSYRLRFS